MPEAAGCRVLLVFWTLTALQLPAQSEAPVPEPVARIQEAKLTESSGLCPSPRVPGRFWSLNDSGNTPRLFALDAEGRALAAPVRIKGARNHDWEGLCADGKGGLWIGDFGNNANKRKVLEIHRVEEPGEEIPEELTVTKTLRFRFPDQLAYPPENLNFDCEAIFALEGKLYVLTKHRSDQHSKLYRLEDLDSGELQDAVLLGRFTETGPVTGAALHADGRQLAVLTFNGVRIVQRPEGSDNFTGGSARAYIFGDWALRQVEGIAWMDPHTLLISNEQKDLFHLRLDAPGWRGLTDSSAESADESP